MVVKARDIKLLKAKKEWIRQGAEYAEKSWSCTFNRMGKADIYERMRNIVKGIAVQRALEDVLKKMGIKYEVKDRKKWYETDKYDIFVDGRKYDVKSFRCPYPTPNKEWFLDCSALVPTDQLHSRTLNDDDIYIFAFISFRKHTLYGYNPKSVLFKKCNNKDGEWIIHGFWKYGFLKPPRWTREYGADNLGYIRISSTSRKDIKKQFFLGGTRTKREFQFETVTLGTNVESVTVNDYFQLFFIRSVDGNIPDGKIEIDCENSDITEIIHPLGGFEVAKAKKGGLKLVQNDWSDIWLYDSYIYLVGFITKGDFIEKSEEIKRFDKSVKQFEPQTDNNRLYVWQLNPIDDLFQH